MRIEQREDRIAVGDLKPGDDPDEDAEAYIKTNMTRSGNECVCVSLIDGTSEVVRPGELVVARPGAKVVL